MWSIGDQSPEQWRMEISSDAYNVLTIQIANTLQIEYNYCSFFSYLITEITPQEFNIDLQYQENKPVL